MPSPSTLTKEFISKRPAEVQQIFIALWEELDALPMVELRWSYRCPYFYYRSKPLCYFNEKPFDMVQLGLVHGALLAQTYTSLLGTGSVVRKLHYHSMSSIDIPELKAILFDSCELIDLRS